MHSAFSHLPFHRETTASNGQPLSWGLADKLGAPFRGQPRLYRKQELRRAVVLVGETKCGFFDMREPQQVRAYLDIKNRDLSGWFDITKEVTFVNGSYSHYLEWVEQYVEHNPRYGAGGVG